MGQVYHFDRVAPLAWRGDAAALPGDHREIAPVALPETRPVLLILGTRGIPASHGGFETFAERLALYMVEQGWSVWVYCQHTVTRRSGLDGQVQHQTWRGVNLVSIAVAGTGPGSTLVFDSRCVRHARQMPGVRLVLGYNTAFLLPLLHRADWPVITNMDGIEWKRRKWPLVLKAWFYLNERLACAFSDALIADHPEIRAHLMSRCKARKIWMIPYGADVVDAASTDILGKYGVEPDRYVLSVARIEPENSILELVSAFSRKERPFQMLCVGPLDPERNAYHREVHAAASDQVLFPGAVHDKPAIAALRRHALAYLHGHTVGGTNPSLVEALGAGSAVVAHRNRFNTWTAGPGQFYFSTENECHLILCRLGAEPSCVKHARLAARDRHEAQFAWESVLRSYGALCARMSRPLARVALLALLTAGSLLSLAVPSRAQYLLGAGDKLEVTLSGSVTRRANIDADGQISMPQIGNITLAGLSLPQAQATLQDHYRQSGVMQHADVLVEIVEYRPFYIDGDVARPGAYPYQPNLTVREAVALAGGLDMVRFRFGENPFLRAADLRSEYETLALERLRLRLRQARVSAELEDQPDLRFEPEEIGPVAPSVVHALLQSEREQLRQHQASNAAELASLQAAVKQSEENLAALASQWSAEGKGAQQEQDHVALMRANVARGASPQVRIAEVQRDLTNAESRYLATQAQVWGAARTASDAKRQLARAQETRRTALLGEAEETTVALQRLQSQIKATAEKFAVVGGARSAISMPEGEEAGVAIFRRTRSGVEHNNEALDAAVLPSDVVEIRLRPGRLLGLAAVPLAQAGGEGQP